MQSDQQSAGVCLKRLALIPGMRGPAKLQSTFEEKWLKGSDVKKMMMCCFGSS